MCHPLVSSWSDQIISRLQTSDKDLSTYVFRPFRESCVKPVIELSSDLSVTDMADNLPGDVIHECQDAFTSVAGGVEGIIHGNQVRGSGVWMVNNGLN